MKIKDYIPNLDDYTILTPEEIMEIWKCLNGMENYEDFAKKREFRIKIHEIIGIKDEY